MASRGSVILFISVCALTSLWVSAHPASENEDVKHCKNPSVTTASGTAVKKSSFCSGELIFEDNFDKLDLEKWQHEHTLWGGGNGEFQYYLNNRQNSFVEDGVFYIRPSLLVDEDDDEFLTSGTLDIHDGSPHDFCTNPALNGCVRTGTPEFLLNPVKSARVRTLNSFNFKYGKLEIRAKTPTGDWFWPALWLMPKLNQYGTWPTSGEIDLMETRGNLEYRNEEGVHIGVEQVGSTIHFGPNPWTNGFPTAIASRNSAPGEGFNKDFHRYQLEWTPESMTFSIDDEELLFVDGNLWERGNFEEWVPGTPNPWVTGGDMAPFDEEFHIIMNLAIGGTGGYFPDAPAMNNGKPKPWANGSPTGIKEFWEARKDWLPTWKLDENNGKEASLQVDYVRVWAL